MKASIKCSYCKCVNWGTAEKCVKCDNELYNSDLITEDFEKEIPRKQVSTFIYIAIASLGVILLIGGVNFWKWAAESKANSKIDPISHVSLGQLKTWRVKAPDENAIKDAVIEALKRDSFRYLTKGTFKEKCITKPIPGKGDSDFPAYTVCPPRDTAPGMLPPTEFIDVENSRPDVMEQRNYELVNYEIVEAKVGRYSFRDMVIPEENRPHDFTYYSARVSCTTIENYSKTYSDYGDKGRGTDRSTSAQKQVNILVGLAWNETSSSWEHPMISPDFFVENSSFPSGMFPGVRDAN